MINEKFEYKREKLVNDEILELCEFIHYINANVVVTAG